MPTAVPHRWQNRAPGDSAARQAAQLAPSSGVPQLEQKRPLAGAEHLGQTLLPDEEAGEVEGVGGVEDDIATV